MIARLRSVSASFSTTFCRSDDISSFVFSASLQDHTHNRCQYQEKVWTLAIAPLTRVRLVTSSALQSRKWQLIGMSQWRRSALCGHPLPALTDNWTHGAANRHTIALINHTRQSTAGLYQSLIYVAVE